MTPKQTVLGCFVLAAIVTVADVILELVGNTAFDPQPVYVFLALILGHQGAKASSEKESNK